MNSPTTPTWRVQWALKGQAKHGPWTDISGEEYAKEHHAESRLEYWRKLSFAHLMEFRVAEGTL